MVDLLSLLERLFFESCQLTLRPTDVLLGLKNFVVGLVELGLESWQICLGLQLALQFLRLGEIRNVLLHELLHLTVQLACLPLNRSVFSLQATFDFQVLFSKLLLLLQSWGVADLLTDLSKISF